MTQGVVQQVQHHLTQTSRVPLDGRNGPQQFDMEINLTAQREGFVDSIAPTFPLPQNPSKLTKRISNSKFGLTVWE